jgi:transposase
MDEASKIIEAFQEEIRLLKEEYQLVNEHNKFLKERVSELERRLGIDSSTSSKPPTSDGLGKKSRRPPLSARGKNKNKGGQKGHKGKTTEQVQNPDHIVVYPVTTCTGCQADLSKIEAKRVIRRQVFDVEIRRSITEHQAEVKTCSCGCCTQGSFPADVQAPVQVGDTLKGIALYLSQHFIPKDRLSEAMEDLFSIPVSDTTLLKYEAKLAQNLRTFYEQALSHLKNTPVKHADETGMRVGGKTEWIHVLSNDEVTYLWHNKGRKCLLEGVSGVLVHDHYQSYLQLETVQHAFCNAHHLRELKALMEYEKEEWAAQMHTLLRAMCHAKNQGALTLQKSALFSRVYDKVVQRALAYHDSLSPLTLPGDRATKRGRTKRRIGHNLAIRLMQHKEGVLRFLKDTSVPFTNNQAEQDLRMVKIKQKVSGCFRTPEGVEHFSIIRSFIGTVKKNGCNVLESLKMAIKTAVTLSDILKPQAQLLAIAYHPSG